MTLVTQLGSSAPTLQSGFIEQQQVADPISIASIRGAQISVEQYDYLAIKQAIDPTYYTMSCSMNIIPIGRWKRRYAWIVPTDSYFRGGQYINVIAKGGTPYGINFLHTGTPFLPVPVATYSIPGHPELTGWTIRVPGGAFTATSDSDFIVYSYGRTEGSSKSGTAYAAPCGQLIDIDLGRATIEVDTLCHRFEIHLHDSRPGATHIKGVTLTTDAATAKQLGIMPSKNVKLLNNPNYRDSNIFISVGVVDPSLPAIAVIYFIDGDGIPDSIVLRHAADPITATPSNISIRVLQGLDSCTDAIIANSALATHPLIISDIHFAVGTPFTYTIPSPLPITLQPGENLVITICGKVTDVNIAHLDTLIFGDGCSTRIPLSITGLAARINWDHDSSSLSLQCGDPDTIRVWLQNNSASHAQEIVELVDIEGVDKSEFTIVANQKGYTTLTNFPLDYGEKMWIDIAFAPDMTKPLAIRWNDRQAFIVAKNALHSDPVINLTAHVTRGLISTSEQVIDFGILPLQTPTTLTLNVSNSGNAPIRVSKILTTAAYVSVTGIAVGDLLLPGASVTISVTASAQSASLDSETIEIWGDGICTPPATLGVKLQGASTIHGVSVLSTSTGFPPTYTCASSSATAQIKNLGPDSLHVIRYSIKYSSDHPDTNAFTLSDDSRSRSIDLWLSKDSIFSTLIKYHPRLAGSHSAIFEYTWDSSGVILTEDIVLFGSSTMLQSGLSESVGNVDTVLRASVENVIAIPIVLNTAIPTEAKVQAISIRAAFGEDLFHFVSVQPAAGYTLTNSSLQSQNGRSYLSASFSSAVAVVNPGNICEVMLEPLVAKNDTSDFEIASVTYFTNTGDTICAEIATHTALIQVASLCADSLLRVGLKGDKLTLYGVSPNPATNQITITSASQKNDVIQISIRDLLGRELTTQRLVATGNTQTSQLDISGIREGTYLLEMKSVNGRAIRRVVVLR
ncbi:MAG: T9SS type A sorting domain-containing protein [Candidatus Kapaibacterium sp.]